MTTPMPRTWKRAIFTAGLLLALPGLLFSPGVLCAWGVGVVSGERNTASTGILWLSFLLVTLGGGLAAALHTRRSLHGRPSLPLRLPATWWLATAFGVLVAVGVFVTQAKFAPGLFLPPALIAAAALPPLWAVSWFTRQQAEGLTWRRGLVAFAGGATVSVGIAIALEILLPLLVLSLVFGLSGAIMPQVRSLFTALAGKDIAAAMTNPSFVYLFVQVAVIAPLAEEFAKPLAVLPIVGRLTRREAFLVSAMAGAGLAGLENVIYAGFGFYLWAGVLLVRALGGAIHPLGAGLVGLAWRDILRGEPRAWANGIARFGLAAGMHAAWNGGSLLVITLGGAQFFGQLPPQINVLGLAAGGTTLAFLIVLGLAALWLGREVSQREDARLGPETGEAGADSVEGQFILSDRAAAIWAFACLVAVVPAGITSLQLLMR